MKYSLGLSALLFSLISINNLCMQTNEIQEKTLEGHQPGWGKFIIRFTYGDHPFALETQVKSPYAHIEENDFTGLATLDYKISGFGTNSNNLIDPDKIPHGDSPLGYAARNGKIECVRILLWLTMFHKDPQCLHYRNNDNHTIYDIAKQSANQDIKQLFLRVTAEYTKERCLEGLLHILNRTGQQELEVIRDNRKPILCPLFTFEEDDLSQQDESN